MSVKEPSVSFSIPFKPVPQKRPRVYRRGSFTVAVDPSKKDKEDFLALASEFKPESPMEGALKFEVEFMMPIPKSKRKTKAGDPHISRPDIDNLTKLVMDALQGTFYKEDSNISNLTSKKFYSNETGVRVNVSKIEVKS